jgi:arginine N-succinyltransferase
MHLVRPAQAGDLEALAALSALSGTGAGVAHRMPAGRAALARAIADSGAAFAADIESPGAQTYLFVLARAEGGAIDGCATLQALAGADTPWFAFRRHVLRQVSADLDMAHEMRALTMCSDLSAHSHLAARYVRPGTDAQAVALLVEAPLRYAAAAPQRFAGDFFASFGGLPASPFWDALGGNFFDRSLEEVETLCGGARQHPALVEMMPHYPVYLDVLPAAAQGAVGQCAPSALPFLRAFMAAGFEGGRYAGLFDGGPILHANAARLAARGRP